MQAGPLVNSKRKWEDLCAIQAQTVEAYQIICYKTIYWIQLRYVVQRAAGVYSYYVC